MQAEDRQLRNNRGSRSLSGSRESLADPFPAIPMLALPPGTTQRTLAIIMGGGAGTRLFPLTKDRSKPAVPIAGKYRLIDIPISNCINSDISQIFVLTMYQSASLNAHVTNTYRFDHFSRGFVSIIAAEQTRSGGSWFQGTADAVRKAWVH